MEIAILKAIVVLMLLGFVWGLLGAWREGEDGRRDLAYLIISGFAGSAAVALLLVGLLVLIGGFAFLFS